MRRAALVLAALVLLPAARARAGDGGDDLGLGDLGAAAKIAPATKKAFDAHVAKAKKLIDAGHYAAADTELKAADKLVPMNDEVMNLMSQVEGMEAEKKKNKGLVERLDAERAAKETKEKTAAKSRRQVDREVRRVERHRHLPRRLARAIVVLRHRRARYSRAVDAAVTAREKCAGAAAMARVSDAKRCAKADARVAARRRALDRLDDDLAVLTTTYRDRKGEKALDALGQ